LEKFISPDLVDLVDAEVDRIIDHGRVLFPDLTVDFLEGPRAGRHRLANATPAELREVGFKINMAYIDSPAIRYACLHDKVLDALRDLLDDEAVPFNSLNFRKGSSQPLHVDTWYMPPPEGGRMAVIWICLEDVHPDAGPMVYVPGSHKIPPYIYSTGGRHFVPEEVPLAAKYVEQQIIGAKLEPKHFFAKRGDMFIWHEQLIHGGAYRTDPNLTRKSLVVHYFNRSCVPPESLRYTNSGKVYQFNPLCAG
jgi:phytanoyl-CoA hydroxylase